MKYNADAGTITLTIRQLYDMYLAKPTKTNLADNPGRTLTLAGAREKAAIFRKYGLEPEAREVERQIAWHKENRGLPEKSQGRPVFVFSLADWEWKVLDEHDEERGEEAAFALRQHPVCQCDENSGDGCGLRRSFEARYTRSGHYRRSDDPNDQDQPVIEERDGYYWRRMQPV